MLADVAGIVSRSHDLGETLGNVVDLVAKRLDADVCSVYLRGSDLRQLVLGSEGRLDAPLSRETAMLVQNLVFTTFMFTGNFGSAPW